MNPKASLAIFLNICFSLLGADCCWLLVKLGTCQNFLWYWNFSFSSQVIFQFIIQFLCYPFFSGCFLFYVPLLSVKLSVYILVQVFSSCFLHYSGIVMCVCGHHLVSKFLMYALIFQWLWSFRLSFPLPLLQCCKNVSGFILNQLKGE